MRRCRRSVRRFEHVERCLCIVNRRLLWDRREYHACCVEQQPGQRIVTGSVEQRSVRVNRWRANNSVEQRKSPRTYVVENVRRNVQRRIDRNEPLAALVSLPPASAWRLPQAQPTRLRRGGSSCAPTVRSTPPSRTTFSPSLVVSTTPSIGSPFLIAPIVAGRTRNSPADRSACLASTIPLPSRRLIATASRPHPRLCRTASRLRPSPVAR